MNRYNSRFSKYLFHIFIIYLFIFFFFFSLPPILFFLISVTITFLHPRIADDAAYRSFRGSNCAASPRGLTAGTSLHDDSTIVEVYVEKQRRSVREEGGEWMIGMACTKFGSFSFKGGLEKPRIYNLVSAIPDQRPGRCGRVPMRLLRN